MKTQILTVIFLTLLFLPSANAQENKKALRQEKMVEREKAVEGLVMSRQFVFIGRFALPTGFRQVDLTTNPNYIRFRPDFIESQMPYFGTAYSTSGYGIDTGMKFKGKPEEFIITRGKKNWDIRAVVSDGGDRFRIMLTVTPSGLANLSISSNRRSIISYDGDIFPPDK